MGVYLYTPTSFYFSAQYTPPIINTAPINEATVIVSESTIADVTMDISIINRLDCSYVLHRYVIGEETNHRGHNPQK